MCAVVLLDFFSFAAARYYVHTKIKFILVLSLLGFGGVGYIFVHLMQFASTPIINLLYPACSTIFITLFYYFFFKERITKGQWVGIGLALLGVLLLEV